MDRRLPASELTDRHNMHFLKCVLGAPEALFVHAHSIYNYTCKLPSLISGFRLKSITYRAQASGLRSSVNVKIIVMFVSAA